MNILHVDDDEMNRIIMKKMLVSTRVFFNLVSCDGLKCAHDHLANPKEKFDLILLDLILPDAHSRFDGLHQLLQYNVPIIVLSGMEDVQYMREAMEIGAKDYFVTSDISYTSLRMKMEIYGGTRKLKEEHHKIKPCVWQKLTTFLNYVNE